MGVPFPFETPEERNALLEAVKEFMILYIQRGGIIKQETTNESFEKEISSMFCNIYNTIIKDVKRAPRKD